MLTKTLQTFAAISLIGSAGIANIDFAPVADLLIEIFNVLGG